ncbi:MAG TPA: sodium transporter, partial [Cytophagales bacterium]|nr:sodium transporter [Cytophagales bacterium]
LDIYKNTINKNASEKNLVWVGRIAVVVSMILALIIAPFLGIDKKGGFEFIQEYTGFVSPGIFAMFIFGFFWKRTTSAAAMFAIIGGFACSVIFKIMPDYVDVSFLQPFGFAALNPATGIIEIPFLDRMGFVFLICVIGMILISLATPAHKRPTNTLEVDVKMFKTSPGFAFGAIVVLIALAILYYTFW